MKIKKLPSGNYNTLVYSHTEIVNGKEKRIYESFTDSDRGVVARMAGEFIERRDQAKKGNLTLAQALDEYIADRKEVCSPATLRGYQTIRDNHFKSIIDLPIKKITQQQIQKEINLLARNRSAKTIKNVHGLFSAVFGIYRPTFKIKTTLKPTKRVYKDLPTPDVIIPAVRGTNMELPVLLAIWLSLTASEMRGINKKIDIKNNILTINRVTITIKGGSVTKELPKEETRSRRLAIPPYIMDLINKTDTDIIVPVTGGTLLSRWRKIQEKNGIEPIITFHDLRHVNASVMHLLGVPEKYAMERGGWKTDATMKTVYQNTFSPERIKFDKTIDEYFDGIMQDEMQDK